MSLFVFLLVPGLLQTGEKKTHKTSTCASKLALVVGQVEGGGLTLGCSQVQTPRAQKDALTFTARNRKSPSWDCLPTFDLFHVKAKKGSKPSKSFSSNVVWSLACSLLAPCHTFGCVRDPCACSLQKIGISHFEDTIDPAQASPSGGSAPIL